MQFACPVCQKVCRNKQALALHVSAKHPDAVLSPESHPASAEARTLAGASSATMSAGAGEGAPAAPDAGPTVSGAGDVAIDPGGAELLEDEPVNIGADGKVEQEPEPVRVHTRNATDRDYARISEAVIRRTDKVLSKVTGLPEEKPGDLQDVSDMVKPGAEIYGPRLGGLFWAAVTMVAFLSLVISKVVAARLQRLPPAS